MQIDIEAHEVDAARTKEFSGRIVGEREETIGIQGATYLNQFLNELLDPPHTAPTHDFSRDFVDDAEGEHCGMPLGIGDRATDGFAGFLLGFGGVEKAQMFRPWNIHQYLQPVLVLQIAETWAARGV